MTTAKTSATEDLSKQDAKYRERIDDCVRQFKEVQKGIHREKGKAQQIRAASRRTMNDTWKVLRRVEATL